MRDPQLRALEQALQCSLPEAVRALYAKCGGVRDLVWKETHHHPMRLLPPHEANELHLELRSREGRDTYSPAADARYLFADDNSNFAGVYVRGPLCGFWCILDHDEPSVAPRFRDTTTFIRALNEAARRGDDWPALDFDFPQAKDPAEPRAAADIALAKRFLAKRTPDDDEVGLTLLPPSAAAILAKYLAPTAHHWSRSVAIRVAEVQNRLPESLLLRRAAEKGDTKAIRRILDHGIDVDTCFDAGQTPLMTAASFDQPEAVRMLLQAGANANAKSDDGRTPLMYAHGLDATRILLAARAEACVEVLVAAAADGAWLSAACMLDAGVDINGRDSHRRVALQAAVKSGHDDLAQWLVACGAKTPTGTRLRPCPQRIAVDEWWSCGELFKKGDYRAVLREYQQLPRSLHDNLEIIAVQAAFCHQQLGDQKRAMTCCERALALNPSCVEAARAICYSAWSLEQFDTMLRWALRAAKLRPNETYAWQQIATAHYELGHIAEAIAPAQRALELDAKNSNARGVLKMAQEALAKRD